MTQDRVVQALALFGRGLSHDLNNLTGLLRGTVYMARAGRSGLESKANVELLLERIDQVCDRLEFLGDQLLLADPRLAEAGETCEVEAVVRETATLLARVVDSPLQLQGALRGAHCAVSALVIRAAVSKVILALASSLPSHAPVRIRMDLREGRAVVVSFEAGPVRENALRIQDPHQSLAADAGPMARISIGLWHVAEAMRLHGGLLECSVQDSAAAIRLVLPPAGDEISEGNP